MIFIFSELVDAHHNLPLRFQISLEAVGGFLNFSLHKAIFNGVQDAAHLIDLVDIGEGPFFQFIGERFQVKRTSQGIDGISHAAFIGDDLLGAQGNLG